MNYHFLPFGSGAALAPEPGDLARLLRRIDPDVVHVHGLHFPADVLTLSKSTMRTPIILQDHANGLPRFWRRPLWRQAFAAAAGVAFLLTRTGAALRASARHVCDDAGV